MVCPFSKWSSCLLNLPLLVFWLILEQLVCHTASASLRGFVSGGIDQLTESKDTRILKNKPWCSLQRSRFLEWSELINEQLWLWFNKKWDFRCWSGKKVLQQLMPSLASLLSFFLQLYWWTDFCILPRNCNLVSFPRRALPYYFVSECLFICSSPRLMMDQH